VSTVATILLGIIIGVGLFWLAERWRGWKGDGPESKMDRPPSKRK